MSEFCDDRMPTVDAANSSSEGRKRKQQSQQARQLLSCVKCRERKVKCDRTKPCSACCARGQPKDCHFVAEGGDYAPIQQSYELKKLRTENLRLKERLRAWNLSIEADDSDIGVSPDSHQGDRPSSSQKRRVAKQRRFQGPEWQDSIYFGSPGLANIITDYATLNIGHVSASLAHLLPRGSDMFTAKDSPSYPFPTMFPARPDQCIPQMLKCLPSKDELLACLGHFETRVNISSFPHIPFEITKSEVERFLSDAEKNAEMCPDMLALLFAAAALGGQHSVWDRAGGQWEVNAMATELKKGDVFIAAAMHALRLASFMHKPSLLGIQALIMIGPYLTNCGRFLDAWTLFGTTIRLAHSIGLHRHPKYLDPAPPTQRDCSVRQSLWWWMLHMDEQYSMTLGRPLGISGIGDCPPPHELSTDPHILRFGEFVTRFTILARQILSSDRLTNAKIDEYTDDLRALLETMPEILLFNRSWLDDGAELPEWPLSAMAAVYFCKTHTYMILLNRQRTDAHSSQLNSSTTKSPTSRFRPVNRTPSSQSSPGAPTTPLLRGRSLVLASCEEILDAFLFFYHKVPAALISWTMAQQAFNACMILLLDALEQAKVTFGVTKVEKAYAVFVQLKGVHKLAGLAIERISRGMQQLRKSIQEDSQPTMMQQGHVLDDSPASRSEAAASAAVYGDTVMSATGMLLLEDPGLQGFVPEAFAPICWDTAGSEPTVALQLNEERGSTEPEEKYPRDSLERRYSYEQAHYAQSTEALQASQELKTAYSAPASHTNSPVVASISRSDTAPTSHAGPAQPVQQRHILQVPVAHASQHHPQAPHSRPAQQRKASRTGRGYPPVQIISDKASVQKFASPGQHPGPASQLRQNSCSSIPQQYNHAPLAPGGLHYPASFAPGAQHAIAMGRQPPNMLDMSDQTSFASFPETMPPISRPSDHLNVHQSCNTNASEWHHPSASPPDVLANVHPQGDGPVLSKNIEQQQSMGSSFPQEVTEGSSAYAALVSQHIAMDEWRRW